MSQCKILIVPEEGWFGQPKYSTPTKNHSTLCRILLLFSSLYTWGRLDHYWSNVHLRDHRSGCLLKFKIKFFLNSFFLKMKAYKYVSLSLGPCITFVELKITYILKSSGRGLEKSELLAAKFFCSHRYVSCRTISLPSFNDLRCKIALFIHMM